MSSYSSYYALGAFAMVYIIIAIVILVLTIVGDWKLFQKAGKPGWASIVPFYNIYCKIDFCFGNGWLFLLLCIPCVNVIFAIITCFKLAKAFGQGTAFGFGLLFFPQIFTLILAFGNYQYCGVDGAGSGSAGSSPYDDMSTYQ